jgi:hypothetical protein
LVDIAKGVGINAEFPVKGPNGDARGFATVKISVIDPSRNNKDR